MAEQPERARFSCLSLTVCSLSPTRLLRSFIHTMFFQFIVLSPQVQIPVRHLISAAQLLYISFSSTAQASLASICQKNVVTQFIVKPHTSCSLFFSIIYLLSDSLYIFPIIKLCFGSLQSYFTYIRLNLSVQILSFLLFHYQ